SNYQSWAKPYTRDWWSDPLLNTDKMLLFFKKILDKNKPESQPQLFRRASLIRRRIVLKENSGKEILR
ncbi:MAG: hypothetical protein K8T10_08775, partial [Candidatus Eremiobacteraeota bacterium]|nr:hypothetical protein [Candidatus Eremiobacteraeota bacterium]